MEACCGTCIWANSVCQHLRRGLQKLWQYNRHLGGWKDKERNKRREGTGVVVILHAVTKRLVICAYGAFRNHIAQIIDRSDGLPLGVCMRKLKCVTLYRVSKLPSPQFWLESKSRTRLFHFASKDLIALLRGKCF